jgi:uncharacterized membrane protein
MNLQSLLQSLRYAMGVFVVFIIFTLILRFLTKGVSDKINWAQLFTEKELLMGLIIAVMVTFMHIQKMKRNS